MDQDELDRAAWRGEEIPDGLSSADTLYFLEMRALYAFFRFRQPDAEHGRREKAKIADTVKRYRASQDASVRYGAIMRDTGAARAEYRKARKDMGPATALYLPPPVVAVIAAADRLVETLDNMRIEEQQDGT